MPYWLIVNFKAKILTPIEQYLKFINGKYSPDIEDVKAVAVSVLRHRLVRNFKAEAENVSVEEIIKKML